MAQIKIISNPYQKEIKYQKRDESTGEWSDIIFSDNQNSRLFADELKTGFFTFIIKKAVDEIVNDYWDYSNPIELVFEGAQDEYNELKLVCQLENNQDKIVLSKSDVFLEDARDILPDIRQIYKAINVLISEFASGHENISEEIRKFTDASDDKIPICVLGNYSSGKSTFINALIGCEILPSGDRPVTAKIYKIERSLQLDRAYIRFEYDNQKIIIKLDNEKTKFTTTFNENEVCTSIQKIIEEYRNESIILRSNKILNFLTNYKDDNDLISDIVEIEIPFVGGNWAKAENKFTIFDTPGSNSASYEKHLQVLKKALENLSNGLPIYVSDYKSLDSTDNENLYKVIKGLKELDDRFTMIVVNKADDANLPKTYFNDEDKDNIMNLAIPKKLYSEGIYFVSSIMGLGAKTDGEFIDDHYAEIFEGGEAKFSNPSSRFYKNLFRYDITPDQLQSRLLAESEKCEDLLWANSGLFAVEHEIQTFANYYSYYNKCQQSHLFLQKLINITAEEIENKKLMKKSSVASMSQNLERDKQVLLENIEKKSDELEQKYKLGYKPYMSEYVIEMKETRKYEKIENQEDELTQKYENQNSFNELLKDNEESHDHIWNNLAGNFKKVFKEFSLANIKEIGTDFVSDIKDANEKKDILGDVKESIENDTAEELMTIVKSTFRESSLYIKNYLTEQSLKYWGLTTEEIKRELITLISGSEALDEQKKTELSQIIIAYDEIIFENDSEEIFITADFKKKLRLLNERGKLNLEKLTKRYNDEIIKAVDKYRDTLEKSHTNSMSLWLDNLGNLIKANIIEYSPALLALSNTIQDETAQIRNLESKQAELSKNAESIREMMSWKIE